MWTDHIVEEVRAQRRKIESDCDNEFDKIFEAALKIQENFKERLVSKPGLEKAPLVSE